MKNFNFKSIGLFFLSFLILSSLTACGSHLPNDLDNTDIPVISDSGDTDILEPDEPAVVPIDYGEFKPNELGDILIIMYHKVIDEPKNVYDRSKEDFKKDLQYLYDNDFVPIGMIDLINNNIDIPAGKKPVILTFDDGERSAFSLFEKEDGSFGVMPDCAVDILLKFSEERPGFNAKAIFYVNGNTDSFKGAGKKSERFKYLHNLGFELGNHTYSHPKLNRLNEDELLEEIGRVDQMLKNAIEGFEPYSFSYPYGIKPKDNLRPLIKEGTYNDITYSNATAVNVGPDPKLKTAPNHIAFDPLNLPRLRASNVESGDLWHYFGYYEKYPGRIYVSDGDPNTITIPKSMEEKLNKDSIINKELIIY